MALKVLMVGGRRCGKTSALASTFDQIINGPVMQYFTVADRTAYTAKMSNGVLERQDVLSDKQAELENNLEEPTENIFLVDSGPTYNEWTYKLELQIPGRPRQRMELEFTDVPGEWFTPGSGDKIDENSGLRVRDLISRKISESDVYIVMIETPNLMHFRDSIAKQTNAISGIGDYLTGIPENSNKFVIFSPIKCEKWIKEETMDQVKERFDIIYRKIITALMAYHNLSICYMPIETAGNILFFEHSDPILIDPPQTQDRISKCKKLGGKMARLANGDIIDLEGTENFNPDPQALMGGNLMRPYSWYKVNDRPSDPNHLYAPHNCEQIPLHIIQFMLKKMITTASGGFWGKLWERLFGTISRQTLEDKLSEMTNRGIIKNNVEGIEYLKDGFAPQRNN